MYDVCGKGTTNMKVRCRLDLQSRPTPFSRSAPCHMIQPSKSNNYNQKPASIAVSVDHPLVYQYIFFDSDLRFTSQISPRYFHSALVDCNTIVKSLLHVYKNPKIR